MIHILTEENSDLKNRSFPLTSGIRKHLQKTLNSYSGNKTTDGYKRLNNVLNMDSVGYHEMKRIKNFFDTFKGKEDNTEYILNGGTPMKVWVDNTLNTARSAVHDFKQSKKDAGIENAFIRHHEKDRASVNPKSAQEKIKDSKENASQNESKNKHKIICVSEAQIKKIMEAMDSTFSTDELSSIRTFKERYNYCLEHLGEPIGRGSSRVVFQLSDSEVLKLAYNSKGKGQNESEMNDNAASYYDIAPEVYDKGADGMWIISEYVLPAKKTDFKQCLGISFDDFIKFIRSCFAYRFSGADSSKWGSYIFDENKYSDMAENNEDLKAFDDYIGDQHPPEGDMTRLANYGMTMRSGYPCIVLLDTGLSKEVWNSYYS